MFEPGGMINVQTKDDLEQVLSELDAKLRGLTEKLGTAHYNQYVNRKPSPEMPELDAERCRLVSYPGLLESVTQCKDKETDSELATELNLWHKLLTHAAVSQQEHIVSLTREVANRLIAHDYVLDGNRISLSDLRDVVRTDEDTNRRKRAWETIAEPHGRLVDDIRKLIKMRNEAAQEYGHNTYTDFGLQSNLMSRKEVEHIFNSICEQTNGLYASLLSQAADKAGIDQVNPWDTAYLLDKAKDTKDFPKDKLVPTISRWADEHGLELDKHGIAMTTVDIPFSGLCMFIKPKDIRILANPTDGYSFYRVLFHEFGHAVHAAGIRHEKYIYRHDCSVFHETMADTFGLVPKERSWLAWFGLTPEQSEQLLTDIIGLSLYRLRNCATSSLFEYRMYDDPDQDADSLYAQIESELQHCAPDPTPRWAANAWFASYPIYMQNYVLAEVAAHQIHGSLQEKYGGMHNSPDAVAEVLKMYIEPGGTVDWREKLRKGTGSDISPTKLVVSLKKQAAEKSCCCKS